MQRRVGTSEQHERAAPSEEARRQLRVEAASLDVEDIVDLCCASVGDGRHDPVRVSIYLEALRQKPGGSEKAQLGACLLAFDLARHGDTSRDVEIQLLLPVIAALDAAVDGDSGRSLVKSFTDKSDAVLGLWEDLVSQARNRDLRTTSPVPELDDEFEVDIDVDLFDAAELEELGAVIDEVAVPDDEAVIAFDRALDELWKPGELLFSADDTADLDRVEKVQELARSYALWVPYAAELQAMSGLFLATHTRSLGLLGRRNKRRDATLRDALQAFADLERPPADAAGWFIAGGDVPGASPHAWEKMAEVLLDFCGFVGSDVEGAERDGRAVPGTRDLVDGYLDDGRSARVPPVLAPPGQRRRR